MTIAVALLMFCILVMLHEGGHFLAAKAVGVKVNEFAIGMGPVVLQKQKGETMYSIRLIPVGGFCAMEGEDEASDEERSFGKKGFWGKFVILFAGPFMNILTTVVILTGIVLYLGIPSTTIDSFSENSQAKMAGMLQGDKVVAVDNVPVESWSDVSTAIGKKEIGSSINIVVERNSEGQTEKVELQISVAEDEQSGRPVIGVISKRSRNPFVALVKGTQATWEMGKSMIDVIGQLFTGKVSPKELTGPIGITVAVGTSMKYGIIHAINLSALISLNLAIVNLLPFPALDGGRILFLVIRKAAGQTISDKIEGKIHFVGIFILFALMIYVTLQDVGRFIF